jgi:putative flavoprotein involved in K+ transport
MNGTTGTSRQQTETLIIGGGQAGLSVGYHLAQQGRPFLILDASERIGDSWRQRWDSLRLFTPAGFSGLDGMPFPAHPRSFPTKDEMGDYLEGYAAHFDLPVRSGVRVDRLSRDGERFIVAAGATTYEADNVVVAMAGYQRPKIPAVAAELDPDIVQLHSKDYRRTDQLREGGVLLVGAGNSGAEIAMEVVGEHPTWVAGRKVGQIPFRIDGFLGSRILVRLVLRGLFHRVLTVKTPMGRKVRAASLGHSGPLIRTKERNLRAAGVQRVPRLAGAQDGRPVLEDGRVLDVANVIWCTGFTPGFDWIDLEIHGEHEPQHERGLVPTQPGLYFVGLHFLNALSSSMIHGVGRDAERVARQIAQRATAGDTAPRTTLAGTVAAWLPGPPMSD